MNERPKQIERRSAVKKLAFPSLILSAWSAPIVQSVVLPVHAQTSGCTREDVPGRWQLELLGRAASSREITFLADGSVTHVYLNRWQFSNNELQITQGLTWVLTGTFDACNSLSGTYVNIFTIPILGNVIVRRGDWRAHKLS